MLLFYTRQAIETAISVYLNANHPGRAFMSFVIVLLLAGLAAAGFFLYTKRLHFDFFQQKQTQLKIFGILLNQCFSTTATNRRNG
jgi:hypothetical protein